MGTIRAAKADALEDSAAAPRARVGRRSLARGAAWAGPALALGAPAPAIAASPCDVPCGTVNTALAFGTSSTSSNGWTTTISSGATWMTGSDTTPFYKTSWQPGGATKCDSTLQTASCGTPTGTLGGATNGGEVVGFGGDPLSAGQTVTYSKTFAITCPTTYTFTWNWAAVGCWMRSQTVTATLSGPGGPYAMGAVTAKYYTASSVGPAVSKTVTLATGTYTWQFVWSFGGVGEGPDATYTNNTCTTNANDIGVTAPKCT